MSKLFTVYSIPQLEMVQYILTRLEIDGVDSLPIARQKIEEALRLGHRTRQYPAKRATLHNRRINGGKPVTCRDCGSVMTYTMTDVPGDTDVATGLSSNEIVMTCKKCRLSMIITVQES